MVKSKRTDKRRKSVKAIIAIVLAAAVFAGSALLGESRWNSIFRQFGLAGDPASPENAVHFIDVGQGDCTLVQTRDGAFALIDAGEAFHGDAVVRYLRDAGVSRLDCCILTHPHSDHYGGLAQVLAEFGAQTVLLPEVPKALAPADSVYTSFLRTAKANAAQVRTISADERFRLGEAEFLVFAPSQTAKVLNDHSLVIRVTMEDASFLITGDCSEEEEQFLLARADASALQSMVLKAAHHGSADASGDAFLDAVQPTAAVISAGKNNSFGLPAAQTLERFAARQIEYYRTDLCGTIVFNIHGGTLSVQYGG